MADPFEHFIDPLRAVFSDPKTSASEETKDATGYYAALGVKIADYPADALKEAADICMRRPRDRREGRAFPSVDEALSACERAISRIEARRKATEKHPRPGAELEKFAEEALKHPLARTAAAEGWICGYADFCQSGHIPGPKDVEKIKSDRKALLNRLNAASQEANLGGVMAKRILSALRNRTAMLQEKVMK